MLPRNCRLALGLFLSLCAGRLDADVRITETTTAEAGERARQGTRSTYIKGARMRIEDLAGASCAEHAFSIRVAITKDDEPALMMIGSAWMAAGVPGADDYDAFARAAIERHLVLGLPSNNRILLALARAQTELYRALAGVGGIPYRIDITRKVEGHGLLSGMVRKVLSGTQASAVTDVTVAPLADSMFAIPDGWNIEKKAP